MKERGNYETMKEATLLSTKKIRVVEVVKGRSSHL
jgi:hypothetical protein